jgi:hypothetical protein
MARPVIEAVGATLLLLCLGACSSVLVSPETSNWASYEPARVELSGVLTLQEKLGPPNYGESPETDVRLTVPVLVLSTPLNVRGSSKGELNAESIEGVWEVQLAALRASELERLVNTHVICRGSLSRAVSGHHFTAVVMTVASIRPNRKQRSGSDR